LACTTPPSVRLFVPGRCFGSAIRTRYIKGPAGKVGKIVEILAVCDDFVHGTTAPAVQFGDGVTATKYADLALGAAGAGPAAGAVGSRN
jgi:hypothetical protein